MTPSWDEIRNPMETNPITMLTVQATVIPSSRIGTERKVGNAFKTHTQVGASPISSLMVSKRSDEVNRDSDRFQYWFKNRTGGLRSGLLNKEQVGPSSGLIDSMEKILH